jgi:hypothetical protein
LDMFTPNVGRYPKRSDQPVADPMEEANTRHAPDPGVAERPSRSGWDIVKLAGRLGSDTGVRGMPDPFSYVYSARRVINYLIPLSLHI